MPPIRVLMIPKAFAELNEDTRLDFIHLLKHAQRLPKTLGAGISNSTETNVWERNGDPLLADAEDDFFTAIADQQTQNIVDLMIALDLDEEEELSKGIIPTFDELIKRSKQQRDDLLAKVKSAGKVTREQLTRINDILTKDLPSYAQVAEKYIVRASLLGKLKASLPLADVEDIATVGAYLDRVPETIKAAEREGLVLTKKQQQKATAQGKQVEMLPLTPKEAKAVEVAKNTCADKLVEVEERIRSRIKTLVTQAIEERWTAKELEMALFDSMGDLNRDWRRVAITELAMANNDAFLLGVPDGSEIWVPQISGSCKYCKVLLEGKTFIVLHNPPATVNYEIEMKYIWPGKNNFGRKASTWVPCLPLHPNCRHRGTQLSRFYAMKEGKPRLKTSIELIQEERARRGMAPDPHIEETLKHLRKQWEDTDND